MAKKYVSQFLDPELAEQWFALVNELHDAGDKEGLMQLRFRKDHPDIATAPNVGIIFWGYLKAAIDTVGSVSKIQARDEEFADLDVAWPLTPIPLGHAPGYWRRHIEPTPQRKSHKEIVAENLESVRARAKHLA